MKDLGWVESAKNAVIDDFSIHLLYRKDDGLACFTT